MGIPQRERIRILTADRQGIGDRGRRPVGQTAVPVEPAERVGHAGNAQKHERDRGRDNKDAEHRQPDRAGQWRQPQPSAEPGDREEQPDHGHKCCQARPQPLPENRPPRTLQRSSQQGLAANLAATRLRRRIGQSRFGQPRSPQSGLRNAANAFDRMSQDNTVISGQVQAGFLPSHQTREKPEYSGVGKRAAARRRTRLLDRIKGIIRPGRDRAASGETNPSRSNSFRI